MESHRPLHDRPNLVPRLLTELTGTLASDALRMELDANRCLVEDSVQLYLDWVSKRIGMQDNAEYVNIFNKHVFATQRHSGETLMHYANEEERGG